MERKSINLLVLDDEIFDWTKLLKAKEKQTTIEGSVKGDFCFKGQSLMVYPGFPIPFVAEIINYSPRIRAPVPPPYKIQGEKYQKPKTTIQYKVTQVFNSVEEVCTFLLKQ